MVEPVEPPSLIEPFTSNIMKEPLPPNFVTPKIKNFNGSTDPVLHLETFKIVMLQYTLTDALLCKIFPATFRGGAATWFWSLKPGSIYSFKNFSKLFVGRFCLARLLKKSSESLMNLKWKEGESLRDFITRFHLESLQVRDLDKNQHLAEVCLKKELEKKCSLRFCVDIFEPPHRNLFDLLERVGSYIDDYEEFETSTRATEDDDESNESPKNKQPLVIEVPYGKARKDYGRIETFYTPLNESRTKILEQIKHEVYLQWPQSMKKSNPNNRSRDISCHYHMNSGHDTEDCRALKVEIERLVKLDYLDRFVRHWPIYF